METFGKCSRNTMVTSARVKVEGILVLPLGRVREASADQQLNREPSVSPASYDSYEPTTLRGDNISARRTQGTCRVNSTDSGYHWPAMCSPRTTRGLMHLGALARSIMSTKLERKSGHHPIWKLLLFLAGTALFLRLLRARQGTDFRGRSVVISGGSRGLGLAIARELAAEGAKLTLLARDAAELDRAAADLEGRGAHVLTIVCDITDPDVAKEVMDRVASRFGSVDMLINNAGLIQVGPVEHMSERDFEDAMDLHFWASLRLIRAAVPHMKRGGFGRIVNIASIGGLIAVPHMAPYTSSKFALVGLTRALRSELAKDGLLVTLVCPGVLKTGSHVAINVKGRQKAEYTVFKLAGALPGTPDAITAARQILNAARHGDPLLVFPAPLWLAYLGSTLFPSTFALAMEVLNRLLPGPTTPEEGDQAMKGRDVEDLLQETILPRLNARAVVANNQLNGHSVEKL